MLNPLCLSIVVILAVCTSISAQAKPSYEARLKELKIELPPAPKPMASYVPAVRTGNLVFLAGQGPPMVDVKRPSGKVGAEFTEAQANQFARGTMLNLLAALRA